LPRSVTNGRSRDALRPNAFSERVAPPATLALADDAALARLVIAAAQRRSPLPASKLSESRGRGQCPCGLEWSPDAWYPYGTKHPSHCSMSQPQRRRFMSTHPTSLLFRRELHESADGFHRNGSRCIVCREMPDIYAVKLRNELRLRLDPQGGSTASSRA